MDVTLYRNFSVENKLNKNITQVANYAATQLVEPTDDYDISIRMTSPTSVLRWDVVNYMQFDGAYYYIRSVEEVRNGYSVIHGEMDLLMTYKSAINQLYVEADRSTSHGSGRLQDDMRMISVDSEKVVLTFSEGSIAESEALGRYVLVTSQAGYSIATGG